MTTTVKVMTGDAPCEVKVETTYESGDGTGNYYSSHVVGSSVLLRNSERVFTCSKGSTILIRELPEPIAADPRLAEGENGDARRAAD